VGVDAVKHLSTAARDSEQVANALKETIMKNLVVTMCLILAIGLVASPVMAANVTEQELMAAATDLGHQYDASYAAKDPTAMARVYADDGLLISPPGPIVRGRDALKAYYVKRFASGARDHKIQVLEVHVIGNGGYGISQFSVTVPTSNGSLREEHGTIVAVYLHNKDGWHMGLVAPSVPERAAE
jgi:uncharacterized protein (TIGR02246 family)